jgi:hypothetical protein
MLRRQPELVIPDSTIGHGRAARLTLGGMLLAYVPFLAYVAVVSTPAYVKFPLLSVFVAPAVLTSLALALLFSARAARVTAWLVVAVLGVWLAENMASILWYLVDWEMRQGAVLTTAIFSAIGQSGSRAPYWFAVLFPIVIAAAYLHISKGHDDPKR